MLLEFELRHAHLVLDGGVDVARHVPDVEAVGCIGDLARGVLELCALVVHLVRVRTELLHGEVVAEGFGEQLRVLLRCGLGLGGARPRSPA